MPETINVEYTLSCNRFYPRIIGKWSICHCSMLLHWDLIYKNEFLWLFFIERTYTLQSKAMWLKYYFKVVLMWTYFVHQLGFQYACTCFFVLSLVSCSFLREAIFFNFTKVWVGKFVEFLNLKFMNWYLEYE